MLSRLNFALVGALTIMPHLAFAADNTAYGSIALPTANIESICRDAQSAAPELGPIAYDACIRDEHSAFEQLRQRWANYSVEARETCLEPGNVVPISYVEIQTCLQTQPGGSLTIPGPAPDGLNSFDIMGSPDISANARSNSIDGVAPLLQSIIPPTQTDPRRGGP